MDSAIRITRRELRDALADWRVLVPLLVLGLIFPAFTVAAFNFALPYLLAIDSELVVDRVIPFGAMLIGFLPTCFSIVIALESFVGEKERNTLETLLSLPLTDKELFFGKFLAVLVPVVVGNFIALAIYTLSVWFVLGIVIELDFLGTVLLLSFVQALVMISGAVVVSGHTSSVRAANLLSVFLILPMSAGVEFQTLLVLLGRREMLWFFFAAFAVVAIILIRLGIMVFNREEILTRETTSLNIGLIVGRMKSFFIQTPSMSLGYRKRKDNSKLTIWRLYTVDIPELLRLYSRALVVVTLLLVAGGLTGYGVAMWYHVVIPVDNIPNNSSLDILPGNPLASMEWSEGIFLHNAKAVLMASGLSFVTLGVGAMIVLMFPMGVTGYFAGGIALAGSSPLTFLAAFIIPHGIVEFPAIVIAGAFSLRLGMSVMSPTRGLTIGDSLLLATVNWVKIVPLVIPLFMLAAFLESNLTPQVIKLLYGG